MSFSTNERQAVPSNYSNSNQAAEQECPYVGSPTAASQQLVLHVNMVHERFSESNK